MPAGTTIYGGTRQPNLDRAAYTGSTPDLILHSLAHFKDRGKFAATFKYQNYVVCDDWFANRRYSVQDGNQIEFRIEFEHNGTFRKVLLDEVTPRDYKDLMRAGFAPWTFAECKALYEERRMKMMRNRSALYDYMKERFFQALHSAFEGLEEDAFAIPANASDQRSAWGVPYWFPFLNSGTVNYTGTFGTQTAVYGDGSTTNVIGGLDASEVSHWRGWGANYDGVVDMQTADALRLAILKTGFKPPRNLSQYKAHKTKQLKIYSSIDQQAQYERLVNAGPDDRRGDLNPFYNENVTGFRGVDWIGMAILDGRANSPIYGIDHARFYPVVHSGFWFNETDPMNDQDNPRLYTVQWDFQYNFCAHDRRGGGFVIHTPN